MLSWKLHGELYFYTPKPSNIVYVFVVYFLDPWNHVIQTEEPPDMVWYMQAMPFIAVIIDDKIYLKAYIYLRQLGLQEFSDDCGRWDLEIEVVPLCS